MRKTKEIYNLNGIAVNKYTGEGWRVVHDGINVINDIFYINGTTETLRNMEVFDTSGETLTEIIVLGLNYGPLKKAELEVDNYFSS